MSYKMFFDGACRGNPGEIGIGIVIKKGIDVIAKLRGTVAYGTNNDAEYYALLEGLRYLYKNKIKSHVEVYGDSELIINQVTGKSKVKAPNLALLHHKVHYFISRLDVSFHHVLRVHNQEADALANQALDEKGFFKKFPRKK